MGVLKLQCFIADIFLTIMIEMNLNFGFSPSPESDVRNNLKNLESLSISNFLTS